MEKKVNIEKRTRKHLADPKLGMTYKERLNQTKIEVKSGKHKMIDCGNGYALIGK